MTTPEREDDFSAAVTEQAEEDATEETVEELEDAPEPAAEVVQEPEGEEPPKYYISLQRLEELRRSPVVLIASRRVPSCPSLSRPDSELADPQALINEIAQHYQDDEDFIRTDMPVMEMVFRILLSRKNEPISLLELHHEITDRWATPVRPITVTETGLQKIMESDTYYGFARE